MCFCFCVVLPSPARRRGAKAPEAAAEEAKAPGSRKHSAKAPMTAADDDAAPVAPKRSSTASAPWGDVTKDEADVKVGGDDWDDSSSDDS